MTRCDVTWDLMSGLCWAPAPVLVAFVMSRWRRHTSGWGKCASSSLPVCSVRCFSLFESMVTNSFACFCVIQLMCSLPLVAYACIFHTSSTAQGGGGSFKNRKPIGEVGCCESGMTERSHWWTERCLRSPLFLWLSTYLPTYLSIYVCIYRSISLSLFHQLPIYLSVYLSTCLSVVQCHSV